MKAKRMQEPADQPRHTPSQIASIKAAAQAKMATYVFAQDVTVNYRNHVLTFRDGCAYPLEPAFVAWLNANSINPTQQ